MGNLNPKQFHEMGKSEFESLPGTFFHGSPTGEPGTSGSSFHVGTYRAALEALSARAGTRKAGPYPTSMTATRGSGPYPNALEQTNEALENSLKNTRFLGRPVVAGHGEMKRVVTAPDPQIVGGRITAPMVNSRNALGSYGKGDSGDMNNSGDVLANGQEARIRSRGQQMRQGIYYRNVAEDTDSVSAIVPNRAGFKTHEDYVVEARAQGKKIPRVATLAYKEIPGQQKMVF